MKKILLSKRADEKLMSRTTVSIIVVVLLILMVFTPTLKSFDSFLPSTDKPSQGSYQTITSTIRGMLHDSLAEDESSVILTLKNDYSIKAFNPVYDSSIPENCKMKSCLCLLKGMDKHEKIITCEMFSPKYYPFSDEIFIFTTSDADQRSCKEEGFLELDKSLGSICNFGLSCSDSDYCAYENFVIKKKSIGMKTFFLIGNKRGTSGEAH
jgi:hypothetical protein